MRQAADRHRSTVRLSDIISIRIQRSRLPPAALAAEAAIPAAGLAEAFVAAAMPAVLAMIGVRTMMTAQQVHAKQRQAPAQAEERTIAVMPADIAGTQDTGNDPDNKNESEQIAPPEKLQTETI